MEGTKAFDPVAQSIREIIKSKGLLQKFVAERAGFSNQQFSDMLNGRKVIRAVDLFGIADALGVDIQEIYDRGEGNSLNGDLPITGNAQKVRQTEL